MSLTRCVSSLTAPGLRRTASTLRRAATNGIDWVISNGEQHVINTEEPRSDLRGLHCSFVSGVPVRSTAATHIYWDCDVYCGLVRAERGRFW